MGQDGAGDDRVAHAGLEVILDVVNVVCRSPQALVRHGTQPGPCGGGWERRTRDDAEGVQEDQHQAERLGERLDVGGDRLEDLAQVGALGHDVEEVDEEDPVLVGDGDAHDRKAEEQRGPPVTKAAFAEDVRPRPCAAAGFDSLPYRRTRA